MGLDAVEIVLRTEEVFSIELPDSECAQIRTVGDLYVAILNKLNLPYQAASSIEVAGSGCDRSHKQLPSITAWNSPDIWITLKSIIQYQLQIDLDDIRESAEFVRDLGCD